MSSQQRDRGTPHHKLFHRKHDGKALQNLPMLFTFTPVQQEHQSHGVVGSFSQAGGHEGVFKANGPVLEKQVGERERNFYAAAASGQWPASFLPGYHGDAGEGRIGLENLLHGLKCPCVMDLKMGTRSVESSEHSILKKVKMSALDLFTRTAFTGVRLEGMSVHRALERGKVKTSKAQSHAISAAGPLNLEDVMMFFLTDESGVRRDVAKRFLRSLRHLLHHFETVNDRFLFIGSSVLLIYDNDNTAPHSRWARALERGTRLHPDTYATLRRKTRVDVRMIDFAHTGPLPRGQQRDHGYITGLKTVISALQHVIGSGSCPQRPIFSVAAAAADAALDAGSSPVLRSPSASPAASPPTAVGPCGHVHPSPQPPQPPQPPQAAATSPPSFMHGPRIGEYPAVPGPAHSPPLISARANPEPHPPVNPWATTRPLGPPAGDHEPRVPVHEATFFSLLGVPPPADTTRGPDALPLGKASYPELPPLADGEERWQWAGFAGAQVELQSQGSGAGAGAAAGAAQPPAAAVSARAVAGGAAARRVDLALPGPTV